MTFTWPIMLASLALVPVLVVAYVWVTRRRDASAAQFGLRLSDTTPGHAIFSRRHLAPAIFLGAIALLLVSLARPSVVLALPRLEGTVILAFDTSTSMKAEDLKPTRLDAAKRAASVFVRKQPRTIKVGVVAFSDNAFVLVQPTDAQEEILAAIDGLNAQGGTSLSSGMYTSLGAIAGKVLRIPDNATEDDLASLDIGHFSSSAIVLLSDGEQTSRVDPLAIADLAAGAGVRVFTVGIGKPGGTTLTIDGYHVATTLNEALLKQIAAATEGTYLRAEDEQQLLETYKKIDLGLTTKGKPTEVTSVLAGTALALLVVGSVLTIRWFGRVP